MTVVADQRWPVTWRRAPLWTMFERIKDVGHPEEQMLSVYRDHGVVRKLDRTDNFNKTALNRDIYQLIDVGWLALNRMKAWQGALGISTHRGIVSGHYICFRPAHAEVPKFLHYLLRSPIYTAELLRISRGVRPSQIEIDNDQLRVLDVRLPPVEEQRRIADFLDAETSRIDALIDAKQQMIDVASARYRATVVNDLLDTPRAPLKRTAALVDCKHRTATYVAGGYPVVSPGDVIPGLLDLSVCHRFVTEEDWLDLADGPRKPRIGDIVYSRNASVGLAALVSTNKPFCMGQDVCLVRPRRADGDGRYLTHVLNTLGLDQIDQLKVGSTFFRVNVAQIAELQIPTATETIQDQLVRKWDAGLAWYRELRSTLTRQVELLRERRQSLITAAVSGELNVT